MPKDKTRGDYQALGAIASQFGSSSDQIGQMLTRLSQCHQTLSNGAWVGRAASAFDQEMTSIVLPSIRRLVAALNSAKTATTAISDELRQTEQACAALLRGADIDIIASGTPGDASAPADGGNGGGILRQVGGFFEGLWEGAKDTVVGLWTAVTDPIGTLKGLAYAITHPQELWNAIKEPYVSDWSSGNYGRAIGRGAFELLSMIFPPGGGAAAKGAAKSADIAADVARVADKANDIARVADKAGDAARVANAAGDAERISGAFTGARYLQSEWDDISKQGAKIYEQIVNTSDDTARIAENVGIQKSVLDTVKEHFFVKEHDLPVAPNTFERANFTPDPGDGKLWQAAANGTLKGDEAQRFQRWMAHEYVESKLMDAGLPYRSAHPDVIDNAFRPTREHFGAHDLAPNMSLQWDPFKHWESFAPQLPQGLQIAPDLSNLDDIVDAIRTGINK